MTGEGKLNWPVPTEFPRLHAGEIHLWCAWLGRPAGGDPAGFGCLSGDEVTRARSFHFASDRERFVAARQNLRRVLAGYAGCDPAALVFGYGPFGKPMLIRCTEQRSAVSGQQSASNQCRAFGSAGRSSAFPPLEPAESSLAFNQSHCGPLWLLAVARDRPVGLDVEELRDLPDFPLMEGRLFTRAEMARQESLSPAERRRAFFHRWTKREAAAKLQGAAFDPGEPFIPPGQCERFTPTAAYVGALAHDGAPARLQQFGWDECLLRPVGAETAACAGPN